METTFGKMNNETPQLIDHYEILDIVGQGGMSTVYKAYDNQLERLVALKLMHPHLADKPDFQSRFIAECRSVAALDHPNIIKVYDVALRDNQLFLIMEYVEGGTLRSRLNQALRDDQPLALQEIVTVMRQVAQALHYAHEQGIVHRDVKPDNVLLKPDPDGTVTPLGFRAVLSDFGLAKRVNATGPITATGELLGTLQYMAPEQFRENIIDSRIDIYAIGVMMYELVTGRPPFGSSSMVDMILMHTQGEPERVQDLRLDTPNALVSIIHRAMLKNPEDRYQSAGEVARELEAIEKSIKSFSPATRNFLNSKPVRTPSVDSSAGPATIYDILPALDRPAIPVDMFSEGGDDIIIVTPFEGVSWRLPFEKPSLLVGRQKNCDIQLEDTRVSREHARIDRLPDGKIIITDIGSLNGMFVGDEKLERNTMTEWSSSQSVKIGTFWLTLRLAKSPAGIGRRLALSAPRTIESRLIDQKSNLRLTPAEAVVDPGGVVIVRVEILNTGRQPQHYVVNVQGLPPDWFTVAPFPLYTVPNLRAERSITFHPPRASASAAMSYDYVIAVTPPENERQVTTLSGTLHVVQYYEFEATMHHEPRGFGINIENRGNSPRYYVIEVRERQNKLIMLPARVRTMVMPGQSSTVSIKVMGKRRRIIGTSQHHPIEVFIRSDGLRPKTQSYDYVLRPIFSWEFLLIFFLALGLVLTLIIGR
jgi:eukaryotic-like serine/threonine-protein kinase